MLKISIKKFSFLLQKNLHQIFIEILSLLQNNQFTLLKKTFLCTLFPLENLYTKDFTDYVKKKKKKYLFCGLIKNFYRKSY